MPIHGLIVKKIHHLECASFAFLDYSKTPVFSDVICTYSLRAKKTT